MYKIFVVDGLRNRLNTGYGALSRGIIRALVLKGCQVYLQTGERAFDKDIPYQDEILSLPCVENLTEIKPDLVFQIGTPNSATKFPIPTLMYTQNALGDLIDDWITCLNKVDGLIVPGEFDACVFRKYFQKVYICPQYVDTKIFNIRPSYRKEGSSEFSFVFVGGYGYRKGTDLLIESFCKAFKNNRDDVELILYCATGLETGFNYILHQLRQFNAFANLKVFISNHSPAWMSRYYNRSDAFITLSRGEGWCMPFHEALLCGKPAIAPASTAMQESIPNHLARFVPVREVKISSIQDSFGLGLRKQYGKPGNVCYEPIIEEAIAAFRELKDNYSDYQEKAVKAREYIVENYSLTKIGDRLLSIISDFLK